jgi:four helix bundle protein
MQHVFDHEKLRVYKTSLEFLTRLYVILEKIPKKLAVYDQLDRASTSIPLDIAEGNGKYTERDRCKFFDIARGSTLECAAALDVLIAKGVLTAEEVQHGKGLLLEIVSMLTGLIKSNSSYRVHESSAKV